MYAWLLGMVLASAPMAGEAAGWVVIDRVVAVVGRDVVLRSELDRRAAGLEKAQAQGGAPATDERRRAELRSAALDELIEARIIAQEAARLDLSVSDDDVNRMIEQVKLSNQLDDATLARSLAEAGITLAHYRSDVHRQLLRLKVLSVVLYDELRIDDDAVQAAYRQAKARDPALGTLAEEGPRIRDELYAQTLATHAARWFAQRRAETYVEVRS